MKKVRNNNKGFPYELILIIFIIGFFSYTYRELFAQIHISWVLFTLLCCVILILIKLVEGKK
jgi:hypothetical protein